MRLRRACLLLVIVIFLRPGVGATPSPRVSDLLLSKQSIFRLDSPAVDV